MIKLNRYLRKLQLTSRVFFWNPTEAWRPVVQAESVVFAESDEWSIGLNALCLEYQLPYT